MNWLQILAAKYDDDYMRYLKALWSDRHRKGLCTNCAKPITEGWACRQCQDADNAKDIQERIRRKEEVLCTTCGKQLPPNSNSIQCPTCKLNYNTRKENRLRNNLCSCGNPLQIGSTSYQCEKCKNKYKLRDQQRRENRRLNHQCVKCGNPLPPETTTQMIPPYDDAILRHHRTKPNISTLLRV